MAVSPTLCLAYSDIIIEFCYNNYIDAEISLEFSEDVGERVIWEELPTTLSFSAPPTQRSKMSAHWRLFNLSAWSTHVY